GGAAALDIRGAARRRAAAMRDTALSVLVPALAQGLCARRIWVFGSVARGVPSRDSDLDVLVEVGDALAGLPFKQRVAAAYEIVARASLPFGCDIIPWTQAELAAKQRADGPFFRTLWEERDLIYEH
ncbi:MAG: nucleotidyltransferase domain-containing protein, partial [Acidiferrobacter sp.]